MLSDKYTYSTGNILSLNELKKKAGLNSRDELIEAIKITSVEKGKGDSVFINNGVDINSENVDRKEMKITVKIFLSNSDSKSLEDAISQVYDILKTDIIESLVIVLNKQENRDDILPSLQCLWTVLEDYIKKDKLMSIGVSDMDTEKFIQLYNWANVKPNIIQINLATCCVVPPALQEFTKQNDIQLLTHSDPNRHECSRAQLQESRSSSKTATSSNDHGQKQQQRQRVVGGQARLPRAMDGAAGPADTSGPPRVVIGRLERRRAPPTLIYGCPWLEPGRDVPALPPRGGGRDPRASRRFPGRPTAAAAAAAATAGLVLVAG